MFIEELTVPTMSDEQLKKFRTIAEDVCGDMLYPKPGVEIGSIFSLRMKKGFDALMELRREINGETNQRALLMYAEMINAEGKDLNE